MNFVVVIKASVLWLGLMSFAIANGALREGVLIPVLGAYAGLIASGVILSGCIFLVAYLGARWYGPVGAATSWAIGVLWLALTLAFEFGFGRLVQHKDWPELLAAYTFEGGNLWPLVLLCTLVAPWGAARIRGMIETRRQK